MIEQLEGRVVVVTGGSGGIGRATALQLAANGAKVVIAGRNTERGDSAVKMITDAGGDAIFVQTDVRYEAEVGALFERAITTFGSLDGLFNNAGIEVRGAVWEQTLADWKWIIDVNLWGVIHGIRTFVPVMMKQKSARETSVHQPVGLYVYRHCSLCQGEKGWVLSGLRP